MGMNALEVRRRVMLAQPHEAVAVGAVASFVTDVLSPLKMSFDLVPIQAGTGDPSPDNIRPITGHDGFTRIRTGVNVWDEELEGGSIKTATGENIANSSTTRSKNYIRVIPDTSYYMLLPWAHIFWYDINKNYISYVRNDVTEDGAIHGKTITAPNNAYYMRFRCSGTYGTTYKNNISINYPATETAYHAYTGTSIETTFPTPPGTVYGGHVRDNGDGTGTLTVDYINYQLTTPFRVGESGKTAQYTLGNKASGHTLATNPFFCNRYKPSNYSASLDNHIHFANATLLAVMTSDEIGTTQTAWRDYFTNNPTYVCYKLETPQTYTLPMTAIQSLIGQNNVWVDNADEVSVEYWGHN